MKNNIRQFVALARFINQRNISRFSCPILIKREPSPPSLQFSVPAVRQMSKLVEQYLNDPRRHFDYERFLTAVEDGYLVVIDVRQPEELQATGSIPGSINIPLAELEHALTCLNEEFLFKYGIRKPAKSTLLVFLCQSGRRSVNALSIALTQGYLNAANYRGGWVDWESHTNRPAPSPRS